MINELHAKPKKVLPTAQDFQKAFQYKKRTFEHKPTIKKSRSEAHLLPKVCKKCDPKFKSKTEISKGKGLFITDIVLPRSQTVAPAAKPMRKKQWRSVSIKNAALVKMPG